MRLLVQQVPRELARDGHDGRAVEVRIGDPGDEVRGAGPERGQADPGATGEPTPHIGHERGRLFVAYGNELDGRAGERVVDVERLLARDAEYVAHALTRETADEELGACRHDAPTRSRPT